MEGVEGPLERVQSAFLEDLSPLASLRSGTDAGGAGVDEDDEGSEGVVDHTVVVVVVFFLSENDAVDE